MEYLVQTRREQKGVLVRVGDTEFAKQLVHCILYCTVGHCFPLLIVLSFCVDCFANSVSSTRSKSHKKQFYFNTGLAGKVNSVSKALGKRKFDIVKSCLEELDSDITKRKKLNQTGR